MAKSLVEIKGFSQLQQKLQKIGDDKSKRKEVLKILGQVANPTKDAAKRLAPTGGLHKVRDEFYMRKKRQIGKTVVERRYTPGMGAKSIGKKVMRRAKNPVLVVRANNITVGGKKGYGGFYLRQFVIPGTKYMDPNPFMDKAYEQTEGRVTVDAERKMERYIQRQIDKHL